jgi:hypothetical protein
MLILGTSLGALALMNAGPDAAGAVPPDAELVSELDRAGKHHAAVVAGEGAQLARCRRPVVVVRAEEGG